MLTLESLASQIYKLYCESDVYDFVSDFFTNDDDQEVISSVIIFLQNIAHFDNLINIRKFTEAAGLFDGNQPFLYDFQNNF
jgi:hypothetical protein